ncbi:DUF3570 domain-containing protein [Halioxenophilus sp. WMMB6]|uniref:DUF3570 domain-containing protein n=1 Tax=Halioxenophilus sp. WMMB6 TaxID=3073815 RepID=UPI00295E5AEF|nr:DUF3570 domain-containing protein [Halioxenophilus sp. WMMB6]
MDYSPRKPLQWLAKLLATALFSWSVQAAVLPEDRADVLLHAFDGGGVEIKGPSVLVRKNFAEKVSLYGNYYVDEVSGASIDVLSYGSPYSEERTQYSLGADYLHNKTMMGVSYTNSSENDYDADTYSVNFSQDFFGDLSTLTMGLSYGENSVGRNGDPNFEEYSDQTRYRIGLTQVVTKNMVLTFNAESVIDEGYLNNPYRQVRFLTGDGTTTSSKTELYPNTRNSDAYSIKGMYYLPYRAAIRADYRYYSDSWGIEADNYELRYIHPLKQYEGLTLEFRLRLSDQTQADFYSDLLPYEDATNFYARDKELSSFTSQQVGFGVTYELKKSWYFVDRTTFNFYYDRIAFDYDNFRNQTLSNNGAYAVGEEPTYSFDANVFRVYVSVWY